MYLLHKTRKRQKYKKGETELLSAYNIPDCPNNKGYIWLLYASWLNVTPFSPGTDCFVFQALLGNNHYDKNESIIKVLLWKCYTIIEFWATFRFFQLAKKSLNALANIAICNCVSTLTKVTFLVTDFSQNAITIAFYGDCPLFSPLLLLFQFWPKRGHDMKDLIEIWSGFLPHKIALWFINYFASQKRKNYCFIDLLKRIAEREMTKDKVIRGPSRGTHLVVIRIEGTGYLVTTIVPQLVIMLA